ncbi:MAG: TIGR04086 family membrane protein [Syntrophomonas sp.]
MQKILSIELRALVKGLILSLILCLIAATVVYYSNLSETIFPSLGRIILITGAFFCACLVSSAHGSKGLLRGVTMGILFFIILFIATLVFGSSHIAFKSFFYSLLTFIIAGGLGGILGIGLSSK